MPCPRGRDRLTVWLTVTPALETALEPTVATAVALPLTLTVVARSAVGREKLSGKQASIAAWGAGRKQPWNALLPRLREAGERGPLSTSSTLDLLTASSRQVQVGGTAAPGDPPEIGKTSNTAACATCPSARKFAHFTSSKNSSLACPPPRMDPVNRSRHTPAAAEIGTWCVRVVRLCFVCFGTSPVRAALGSKRSWQYPEHPVARAEGPAFLIRILTQTRMKLPLLEGTHTIKMGEKRA